MRWSMGNSRKHASSSSVFVVSMARTPIGSFLGGLKKLSAPVLAAEAIKQALRRLPLEPTQVGGVCLGHALPAGCGQNATRQACVLAGIPSAVDCWSLNKVCASGLKAISAATQAIRLGEADVMVAGGMESMSRVPFLVSKLRQGGHKLGHDSLLDSVIIDGLWDPHHNIHMGSCSEKTCKDFALTRESLDIWAINSYHKAAHAWANGCMSSEGVIADLEGLTQDEEIGKLKLDKVAALKSPFALVDDGGVLTAANSSKLSDGAAVVVLMSEEKTRELDLEPIARIAACADAAVSPIDFNCAPAKSVKLAVERAGMKVSDVDFHEVNEAFACTPLVYARLLGLDHTRINLHGGAVAIGHPLGASGARIFMSAANVLGVQKAKFTTASICNGGGGATSVVLERI